jgi:hypothetical protein
MSDDEVEVNLNGYHHDTDEEDELITPQEVLHQLQNDGELINQRNFRISAP